MKEILINILNLDLDKKFFLKIFEFLNMEKKILAKVTINFDTKSIDQDKKEFRKKVTIIRMISSSMNYNDIQLD